MIVIKRPKIKINLMDKVNIDDKANEQIREKQNI